ncbi:MAG: amidophosphoribosyltransferase [Spirochaetaceae bacterium]|nr:amidophosphoribosyltransferase [Spirochaetaceae bacterium]
MSFENCNPDMLKKLNDKCGVLGVYLNSQKHAEDCDAARLTYYGLFALQHRGQESAGIAVKCGDKIKTHKDFGLVQNIFSAADLEKLCGHISLGHVLYSATEDMHTEDILPFVSNFKLGQIAVSHNGQLINYSTLREYLEESGCTFASGSNSEIIAKLVSKNSKKGLERALTEALQMIKGAFAVTIMTENCLMGARDPNGIRPLCLGQLENGWVLASESCAIDAVGAAFVRDIQPGEVVIINDDGVLSFSLGEKNPKKTCVFEYVYFSRPDTVLDGISVQEARFRMGEVLAQENPVDADVVIGVPDAGLGAAMGFSKASGIPYAMGIVRNNYVGRTVIAPTQQEREHRVFVKFNALKSDVKGKRVILIDDSIISGSTSRRLVTLLRNAGAKEVHFRVSSPPVRCQCYFGIHTPCKEDLISARLNADEICREIGADSMAFISPEGMMDVLKSLNPANFGYCKGCFSGEYPFEI